MAALGIDGLVSGLDTTSLISQLMQVEAMPQTLLKSKQTTTQSLVSALQGLNTKVASLAESATKALKPQSWEAAKATSSSTSVTAAVGSAAQPGSISFSVERLAQAQVTLSAAVPEGGTLAVGTPPAVTVRNPADGTTVTVNPATGSLADVAKALNDNAATGVRATVVRVSGGTTPSYRLQLTGTETGTAHRFEVFAGTAADVAASTAPRLDATQVTAAQDARVVLWKGAGAGVEVPFEQSSNTFSGLMTGVDVTVTATTPVGDPPVTVTVERDAEALKKLASGLVGAMGVVLSDITSRTSTTTKTGTDGKTTVSGGLFSGDSAVRAVRDQLTTAMSGPVDGRSPASVGIVLGRDGTFTLDEAAFSAALAADPARVQATVSAIATRVEKVATSLSDPVDGSLTLKIKGQETLVKDMGNQIEAWDRRLELRRANLQRTYSALEVSLSRMQSQSSWLAGQLSGLAASSGS